MTRMMLMDNNEYDGAADENDDDVTDVSILNPPRHISPFPVNQPILTLPPPTPQKKVNGGC